MLYEVRLKVVQSLNEAFLNPLSLLSVGQSILEIYFIPNRWSLWNLSQLFFLSKVFLKAIKTFKKANLKGVRSCYQLFFSIIYLRSLFQNNSVFSGLQVIRSLKTVQKLTEFYLKRSR